MAARLTDGKSDFVIASKQGMSIRFNEDEVRSMGRTARGVRAINLEDNDEVVSLSVLAPQDQISQESTSEDAPAAGQVQQTVLTIFENGYGNRTKV